MFALNVVSFEYKRFNENILLYLYSVIVKRYIV